MWQQPTKEHQRTPGSPLPTTRVDFQKSKSKSWSKMLRNTKTKTRKLEEKSRLRMDSKVTAWTWNTQSMTKNSKTRSTNKIRESSWAKSQTLKDGFHQIKM
jgi:hypothetical protein